MTGKPKVRAPSDAAGSVDPAKNVAEAIVAVYEDRVGLAPPGHVMARTDLLVTGRHVLQPSADPVASSGEWWCAPAAPQAGGRTVVLSDVHLGNGARTCWYQRAVHEGYLSALLDYVVAHAGGLVNRLVILGDFFDFWTYPPGQRPPTLEEIVAANPKILGPDGKLAEAIAALDGNAVYLRGNHDITMTQKDLLALDLGKHRLRLLEDVVVDDSGILLTHGHHFTMFNAPDRRYPGDVPVGHFVTRAIAHLLDTSLGSTKTAADLADQGSPYGFSLSSFAPALAEELSDPGPEVTNLFLDYMAQRCGLAEDTPIVLANGDTTTLAAVKDKYAGLWDDWVARSGGGEIGESVAAKAAFADYDGTYMAWFAQKHGWERGAVGAVIGHTHIPRLGIVGSEFLYANSGFECPSLPDTRDQKVSGGFTFAVIDADGTPSVWCVVERGGGYCVGPASPPDKNVLVPAPLSDFSCYVSITNPLDAPLELAGASADKGWYVVAPPVSIAPGATGRIWLQDVAGPDGAEGSCAYTSGGAAFAFQYGCPTLLRTNYAHGGTSFVATTGSPPDGTQPAGSVPSFGHPLYVDFTAGGDPGPAAWTPRSLLAEAVVAAGFWYDPKQDIIFSRMDPLQRQFGYAYGDDDAALAMNSVIDCEPIFFDYAGKTWMIELWKGQYGLETGCEIGVYHRPIGSSSPLYALLDATIGRRPGDPAPSHNQFFDCVGDDDRLMMSSKLYRNGTELFRRGPEKHWWLTGFRWGVLSEPSELTMDVSIECLDAVMTSAFTGALAATGYQGVTVSGNTVSFTFDTPKTPQPRAAVPTAVSIVRAENKAIVDAYDSLGLTSNDPNTVGDQGAAVIGRAFAIYSEEFFLGVIASLANLVGVAVGDLVRTLADDFRLAADDVSRFVTDAGYAFESWVAGIGDWIGDAFDFSCVVEISNRGNSYDLVRVVDAAMVGNWGVEPPALIPAGGVGRFWLRDPKPSTSGSLGWVRYAYTDAGGVRRIVEFGFSDPTGWNDPNTARVSTSAFGFYTKTGSAGAPWNPLNVVTTGGHPFYVVYVWGNASIPGDA